MMNFTSKIIFTFTLIMGILMVMSSSSWMGMWLGLELNLLSFIPLMIDNNLISSEAAIKYFLIQASASLIFLFTSILYIIKFSIYYSLNYNYENLMINLMMMLKLGAAPFHFWFPHIIEILSWNNVLTIMTLQKLSPLTIISYTSFNNLITIFIICSSFIGAMSGLNQTSLKKILSFSSINHMSWMFMAMIYSNFLWMFYFLIYFIINLAIISMFKMMNLYFINQIFLFNNKFLIMKFCVIINMLSLSGIPPFLGFLPKWLVIEHMLNLNFYFMIFFLIMMNLVTMYFYIRLTFSTFLLKSPNMKWNFLKLNINKYVKLYLIFMTNLLTIISMILLFLMNLN